MGHPQPLPLAPGPEKFGTKKPWALRPLRASTFMDGVRLTATPAGRALIRESEWPELATKILELPEGLRARPGAPDVLLLAVACGCSGFELGLLSLQATALAFRAHQSSGASSAAAAIARELEDALRGLSLKSAAPAEAARQMPRAGWEKKARVVEAEPIGVKRGRAE